MESSQQQACEHYYLNTSKAPTKPQEEAFAHTILALWADVHHYFKIMRRRERERGIGAVVPQLRRVPG
jgi:hypothetical protein